MKTLIKRLLKVLLVFSLFTSLSMTGSNAEPVTLTLAEGGGDGDDDSYKMNGVSIFYDGVYYNDVYLSTNNVISFGASNTDYDQWPSLPSISFGSLDWTIDYNPGGGALNDANENLTVDRVGNVITVTWQGRSYADETNNGNATGNVNKVVTTITLDALGNATYSYTVNADFLNNASPTVAGPDYSANAPRTGGVLTNGTTKVALSIVNSMRRTISNSLVLTSAPKISESNGKLTCSSGNYNLQNGGSTTESANLSSVTYTLVVDGAEVSRVTAGNSRLPSHMLSSLTNLYAGLATTQAATFDMAGKTNYSASCNVMVTQGSTVLNTSSDTIADAATIAAKAKAASDAEAARQAALAEFNSKENRLKRMAKAAKAGN